MDRAYIRLLSQAKLEGPILVAGFPGVGNVGVMAVRFLIESLQAEKYAELYSPLLPDHVTVDGDGICSLLKYNFFAADTGGERRLLMLVGDSQPPVEDITAYYEICGDILDFVENLGCKFIITLDGFPSLYAQRAIYVAGTSRKVISDYTLVGARVYDGNRIIGLPGLLLGIAKIRDVRGVCILSPVTDLVSDNEAAFNAYKFLRKALGLGVGDKNALLGFPSIF
ncbi:MAG: PAC2 family protein [Candidatus Bathyarchaeia archaeon]